MLQCTPFLLFDGNCAEAMTFYHQCPGGELTLTKLGDTPMKNQFPPEKHNRMINAHLKSGAIEFSATDWMASPAYEPKQGDTYAIFVLGGTYDELKAVFEGVSKPLTAREDSTSMQIASARTSHPPPCSSTWNRPRVWWVWSKGRHLIR